MSVSRWCAGAMAALIVLPGCMMKERFESGASRFNDLIPKSAAKLGLARAEEDSPETDPETDPAPASPGEASAIIAALQARPTTLQPATPYAQVADAVIASDARVAEAELRVAQLRAEAAQTNWLPKFGPRLSLDSLGDWVAELVVNQVLFDNGRKQAERDLAKANVEIAAVAMVEDVNRRVHDALALYLKAEEGRDLGRHFDAAAREMAQFEWVMDQRVRGGVSDMSDLNVLRQKLAAIRARAGAAREQTGAAMAELNAMANADLGGVSGLGRLSESPPAEALAVLRSRAERERALAEARIQRASHLPGLTATGVAGEGGLRGALEVTTETLFGLGTASELKAIEATRLSADRRVAESAEVSARQVRAQSSQLQAYRRQLTEAEVLTAQAKQNLSLFRMQYEGGQRQVMDVVGVYETYASALERALDLKYQAARAELELALIRGALAEGARI